MTRVTGRVVALERRIARRPDPNDLTTWTDADLWDRITSHMLASEARAFMAKPEEERFDMVERVAELTA